MNISSPIGRLVTLPDVIRSVSGLLGGWQARGLMSAVLMVLVHNRMAQIGRRIERLMVRFRAGNLPPPRVRIQAVAAPVGDRAKCERTKRIWPGRFGWSVAMGAHWAAGYGAQLRTVLTQPEMVALLIAAPQTLRILRPMCRMLAVETQLLRPGEPTPPPRDAKVAKPRIRKKREPIDWGRIPLPRGVLAWAKREKARRRE